MKLPKNFGGGGGIGDVLSQARASMERAKHLDEELALERLNIDKGPVKCVFSGLGELMSLKLDASVVNPAEIEDLEDLIVSAIRDGFSQAVQFREARVKDIMPNIPGIENLLG